MLNVDWGYLRKNCESCAKATAFFAEQGISVVNRVDARTTPLVDADALRLVTEATDLYVTRGTKVVHFDLKQSRPDDDSPLPLLIGRSGKLRAPALKVGQTLIVGFDRSTYERVFR